MTRITTDMSTLVIFGTRMLQCGENLGFWAASEILALTTPDDVVGGWPGSWATPDTVHECYFWQAFGEMLVAAMLNDAKRVTLLHALSEIPVNVST